MAGCGSGGVHVHSGRLPGPGGGRGGVLGGQVRTEGQAG